MTLNEGLPILCNFDAQKFCIFVAFLFLHDVYKVENAKFVSLCNFYYFLRLESWQGISFVPM